MRDELSRVIELQSEFSSSNTPAMQERGQLIRHVIPQELASILRVAFPNIRTEGRDGTGQRSLVPWVRMFDPERSPSARDGWYLVFLFHEDATGVTLSLNQAATEFRAGAFVPLPSEMLAKRVAWARERLPSGRLRNDALGEVELGTGSLAAAYERGHVLGYSYRGALPVEAALIADIESLLSLLTILYDTIPVAPPPGMPDPVLAALQADIAAAAGKAARVGAPRRLSAAERTAIEMHAMFLARELLQSLGWTVEDSHLNKPFDYIARRGDDLMYVEVKGTTTAGDMIILTRNEVAHHLANPGRSTLIVVRNIIMIPNEDQPTCTGGIREMWMPWLLDSRALDAMAYEYRVPRLPADAIAEVASRGALPLADASLKSQTTH